MDLHLAYLKWMEGMSETVCWVVGLDLMIYVVYSLFYKGTAWGESMQYMKKLKKKFGEGREISLKNYSTLMGRD